MGDDWPWLGLPTNDWDKVDGFEDFPNQAAADSVYRHWSVYYQAQAIRDTLVANNMPDTLVGGNISELGSIPLYYATGPTNAPMHYHSIEMYNRITNGGPEAGMVEDEFLHYPVVGASKGQSMQLLHYYGTSKWGSEKPRWDNFALACHYLIAGPKIYFGICRVTTDFRQMGWIRAIDFNIGQPVIPNNYEDTTQHSWYVWNQNDHIYARDFANALVLVKFKPAWNSPYDSSTIGSYALDGYYRRLWADGSLGDSTNQVSLLNSDGAILIPTSAAIDTTAPCQVSDLDLQLGDESGDIIASWSAPGEDGCDDFTGVCHHYEIRYSGDLITEQNWSSAGLVDNPPSPASPNSAQSDTIELNAGQRYYIAIKAFDEMGNSSPISNCPDIVTSGIPVPDPRGTEIDLGTNSVEVSCWSINAMVPVYYEFALDTVEIFPLPLIEIDLLADSIASATYSELSDNLMYFWRCRAMASDHSDSSEWSTTTNFTLSPNGSSNVSESDLIYPPNGAIIDSDIPIFLVDYVPGTDLIYIQVDDNAQFDSPVESGALNVTPGQITSWQIPEPIEANSDYFWRASSDNILWTSPFQFSAVFDVYAYPVPFRVSDGHQNIVFKNVPSDAKISIATVSGNIVRTEKTTQPGDWIWDVKNNKGDEITSGVYLYNISFNGGASSGKLVVIR